jgi:hypothetical protein
MNRLKWRWSRVLSAAKPYHPSGQRAVEQTMLEIPEVRPRVIRLRTYRTQCGHCQQTVSSTHPLQVSQATGAAGTHLGPRAWDSPPR